MHTTDIPFLHTAEQNVPKTQLFAMDIRGHGPVS